MRVAAVVYGTRNRTSTQFRFDHYTRKEDVLEALGYLREIGGSTGNSVDALEYVKDEYERNSHGNQKFVLMLLGNASRDLSIDDYYNVGADMAAEGYDIITIGIGKNYENEVILVHS